jgi:hypothetical protein
VLFSFSPYFSLSSYSCTPLPNSVFRLHRVTVLIFMSVTCFSGLFDRTIRYSSTQLSFPTQIDLNPIVLVSHAQALNQRMLSTPQLILTTFATGSVSQQISTDNSFLRPVLLRIYFAIVKHNVLSIPWLLISTISIIRIWIILLYMYTGPRTLLNHSMLRLPSVSGGISQFWNKSW